jgi:hypothetical protein
VEGGRYVPQAGVILELSGKCVKRELSFGAEDFVFQFAVQECNN